MGASPDSIRVVGEADLLDLARVARSTWQNWIRKELLDDSPSGLYDEAAVVEAAVVGLLVSAVELRAAKALWLAHRNLVLGECLALPLESPATLDVVIDTRAWELAIAHTAKELHQAIRAPTSFSRKRVVLLLADDVVEARRAFWARAVSPRDLATDKRRRPRRQRRASPRSG